MDPIALPVIGQISVSPKQPPRAGIRHLPEIGLDIGQNETTKQENDGNQKNVELEVHQQDDIAVQTNGISPREFPLFSKLPVEIRLMIWHEALQIPRFVEVVIRCENETNRFASPIESCTSPTPPPALLGACHESRAAAQRKCQLSFAIGAQPPTVYFNADVDHFLLTCNDTLDLLICLHVTSALGARAFQAVRRLALGVCPDMGGFEPRNLFLLENLLGLETLTLIPHGERDCCAPWRHNRLRALEADREPDGYREEFFAAAGQESVWMPGMGKMAPKLLFMEIDRAAGQSDS